MRLWHRRSLTVVGLATAVAALTAGTAIPTPSESDTSQLSPSVRVPLTREDADSWLDGLLPALLERESIAGASVAIVRDGEVVTERGFGLADTGASGAEPRDMGDDSLIRVGSISKLFVGTAVMQLVANGDLDLDAPIAEHLDFELPTSFDTPITMRHLVTHTAGFEDAYTFVMIEPGSEVLSLSEMIRTDPPEQIFEPGTVPAYSNYGVSLAGYIVERITDRDLEEYLQTEILDAAGMTTASFAQPLPGDLEGLAARPYATAHADEIPFELVGLWPAGSLSASASDMSAFMLAQLGQSPHGELLGTADLETLHAPALDESTLGGLAHGPQTGVTFWQELRGGYPAVGHGGDLVHSHAQLTLFPDEGMGIFIGMNSTGRNWDSSSIVRNLVIDGFAERYLPEPNRASTITTDTASEHAAAVAGTYQLSRRSESTFVRINAMVNSYTVVAEDETLLFPYTTDAGGEPLRFMEVEPWVWEAVDGSARIAVDVDDAGTVQRIGLSPAFTLEPMPVWRHAVVPVLGGSLVVLLFAIVAWPVRAMIGARMRSPLKLTRLNRTLRLVSMLGIMSILGALALWFSVQTMLASGGAHPPTLLLRGAQVATALGALAAIPAWWRVVNTFAAKQWWHGSLAAAIALALTGFGYAALVGGLLQFDLTY